MSTETNAPLATCPFCGSDAVGLATIPPYHATAVCQDCKARGPVGVANGSLLRREWVDRWNIRSNAHRWIPIESAPKDGQDILAWDEAAGCALVMRWDEEDGWIVTWNDQPNADCYFWMPLPEPHNDN